MTRKALHSALLEVGLFYQRGWSQDRIAWFAHRLRRRRIRAEDAVARARKAAEQRTVVFEIPEEATSPAGATANERLVARVRAGLSRQLAADARTAMGFVCAVCGEPATGWTRIEGFADGRRVTDGYATCLAHRSREAVEQLLITRTG